MSKTTVKRTFDSDSHNEMLAPKKSRFSDTSNTSALEMSNNGINNESVDMSDMDINANPQLSSLQIQQMMANVHKQIEERKKQLNIGTSLANIALKSSSTSQTSAAEVDSKTRIAQLTAQIQARLANRPNLSPITVEENSKESKSGKPTPLILNAEGRTVDITGKEVQLIQRMPTLKANIRAQKKEQFIKLNHEKQTEDSGEHKFYDSRVELKAAMRPKRNFKFHEKGTFENLAQRLRTKAQLEKLQKEIAQAAKKTGISSAARLALLSSIVPKKQMKEDEIPDIEWWDSFVLKDNSYLTCIQNDKNRSEKYDGITHLVEHPIQMKPPSEPTKPVLLPVFLTKRERKKLRRQNRREAWKDKQEKIRIGLEPPPDPKVKMSNMMRVLGQQAVQDPTKIEAHVREQIIKRQKAHEEANAARKLTGEQKKQKKTKKIKEDTSFGVNVAVYRVLNLNSQAKKFKVEANIKQLHMTGVVVLYRNVNVIVVEGGPKQQKKFKRLMLQRVKWAEEQASKDGSEAGEKIENKCFLVWEGTAKSRVFGDIKFKLSPNESFAREVFKNHGVEHYWDLAYSMSILDANDT